MLQSYNFDIQAKTIEGVPIDLRPVIAVMQGASVVSTKTYRDLGSIVISQKSRYLGNKQYRLRSLSINNENGESPAFPLYLSPDRDYKIRLVFAVYTEQAPMPVREAPQPPTPPGQRMPEIKLNPNYTNTW